ncbi:deoxynucleoside triphosphate triphosphohydrolase SAMHD1 [Eurytemora carolleeae]|uniref:deoxynucleoside triphosphate triphosphohydrolase SAMHD1 n=1 Tax=Eurytemora carolleeae TaxID=1294199 RepID=UPI000C7848AB|nr:deoxynucleoside triphosphate triphosphohydrolase SAMHD1 [Eurytemora carolleeae]|eukprot:XP_023347596.1 deoxynucleoside triphosphate triphosphohydrolase SAMHD1-like [Eurytemora affinis]
MKRDKDGVPVSTESPRAKDWQRLLQMSDGYGDKNMFINDGIHGHIKIPGICRAVIDTPQFDRLRGIKQLGTAFYVYPSAKHTRWEHSVGVMHLAGEFIDALRHPDSLRPNCCDYKDKLCVMLAGLCHDLGHGPYSHLWEHFVSEARPDNTWHHEQSSIDMLDFLIQENNLWPIFMAYDFTDLDLIFIKELIYGPLPGSDGVFKGRGPEKHFLYEIVANKISSIDVDKWDYFLRDNKAMNIGLTFDYKRFICMSRLVEVDGKTRLALADKEARSVEKLFEDRTRLHEHGYQHRVVKKIDRMYIDILLSADKRVEICVDREGKFVPLSEACNDMFVFSQLTDEFLFNTIRHSRTNALKAARQIIHRISTRKLYKVVGLVGRSGSHISQKFNEHQVSLNEFLLRANGSLSPEDLTLSLKRITSGLGRQNPVEKVLFVNSKGQSRNYSSKYLKEIMPVEKETLLVILRREGEEYRKEAVELVRTWLRQSFEEEDYEISSSDRE